MHAISVRRIIHVLMSTALATAGLVTLGAAPGRATVPCQETFTSTASAPIIPGFPMISVPPDPPGITILPMTTFSTVAGSTARSRTSTSPCTSRTRPSTS